MEFTPFETAIKNYLDEHAKEDPAFASTYAKPNKSVAECCKYITQEVEKAARRGKSCVAVTDEEVYGLAIHYYDEDDIVIEGPKNRVEVAQVSEVKISDTTDAGKTERKARKPRKPKATVDPNMPEPLEIPIF